jgi:NodT family efflux transporter outer membrane factor (OMF) lipoprotein
MNLQNRLMSRVGLSAVLSSLILAACAVGPNYKAPRTDLAPFHNATVVAAKEAPAAPPLDQWWTGFNDPMLVTIIQRALTQNLDLEAAFARVRQARAAASGAGAQLLPTVDMDASATAEKQSLVGELGSVANGLPTFHRDVRDFTVGPAASWEIDLFGGLRRTQAAARAEAQAAQADQAGTRVTVVADAADAYLQIRGYQARLAIAQNQIDTDEHLLRLVRARYEAGAGQGREIAQADALLKQARASLPPLRIGLEEQLNRLDVLMGAQPGTYAHELQAPQDIPSIPTIPGDERPSDVLRRRPDIIAAERRLAASNQLIGARISDYYPKISLSGALGYDTTGRHLFRPDAFQAIGTGAVRWRLFDFGKVDAEVAQARGANAEALSVYRQSVLRAAEDVENSLVVLAQTKEHVLELKDQVDSLLKARDLSEQAYRAGSITLTDVLDADRQLLSAREELEVNRADVARAAVAVFRALGGGWDT